VVADVQLSGLVWQNGIAEQAWQVPDDVTK
jgi:hypothetical protein